MRPMAANDVYIVLFRQRIQDSNGNGFSHVELLAPHWRTTVQHDDDILRALRGRNVPWSYTRVVILVKSSEVRLPFSSWVHSVQTNIGAEILPPNGWEIHVSMLRALFYIYSVSCSKHSRIFTMFRILCKKSKKSFCKVACDCHFGVCNQAERQLNSSYWDMIGWTTWLNFTFLSFQLTSNAPEWQSRATKGRCYPTTIYFLLCLNARRLFYSSEKSPTKVMQ